VSPPWQGVPSRPWRRDQGFSLWTTLLGLLLLSIAGMAVWSAASSLDPVDSSSAQQARPFEQYGADELLQLKAAYAAAERDSEARFRRHQEGAAPSGSAADLVGRVAAFQAQASRSTERRRLQADWASHSARLAEIERELELRASPIDRWILAAREILPRID
jgi:hypothetical protein